MGIKNRMAQKALGLAAATAGVVWRSTIDWRAVYSDPRTDPVHPQCTQRFVFACWHEVLLMPILLRGHRNMLALASEHGDGEIISRAMKHLGWKMARGSTTRGGISALMRMLRDDHRHLNFTPDGPKGPRREMQVGPIFLASKLNVPIVCVGYGFDRPWRMRSWDRFAVPRPFSRGRAVFAPPLHVPAKLDRNQLEAYRCFFGQLMTWATDDAEAWAQSGKRRLGEVPLRVGAIPPQLHRWEPSHAPRIPESLEQAWTDLGNPSWRIPIRHAA